MTLLTGFRNYLHYHLKATKTYMHMRMRKRVVGLLQGESTRYGDVQQWLWLSSMWTSDNITAAKQTFFAVPACRCDVLENGCALCGCFWLTCAVL